jgi:hypothetical protein
LVFFKNLLKRIMILKNYAQRPQNSGGQSLALIFRK